LVTGTIGNSIEGLAVDSFDTDVPGLAKTKDAVQGARVFVGCAGEQNTFDGVAMHADGFSDGLHADDDAAHGMVFEARD
jgi:hypothetical protein